MTSSLRAATANRACPFLYPSLALYPASSPSPPCHSTSRVCAPRPRLSVQTDTQTAKAKDEVQLTAAHPPHNHFVSNSHLLVDCASKMSSYSLDSSTRPYTHRQWRFLRGTAQEASEEVAPWCYDRDCGSHARDSNRTRVLPQVQRIHACANANDGGLALYVYVSDYAPPPSVDSNAYVQHSENAHDRATTGGDNVI